MVIKDERDEIRRQMRFLYQRNSKYIDKHKRPSFEIEKEIYALKKRLAEIERLEETEDPEDREVLCKCDNPNCRKPIRRGDAAMKFGHYGLCCNWPCLMKAMDYRHNRHKGR